MVFENKTDCLAFAKLVKAYMRVLTMSIFLVLSLVPAFGFSQTQQDIDALLTKLITTRNSRDLSSRVEGARLISYGKAALPFVSRHFVDTSITSVYSEYNKVLLRKGEIAMIIADRIETMPYALLTDVQNCTLDFCEGNPNLVEYYISFIRRTGADLFQIRYDSWFKSPERKRMR